MFKPGDRVKVIPAYSGPLQTAHVRITVNHGFGPFKVVGVHPQDRGGQVLCLQVGGTECTNVDSRIFQLA
jgi:hypothetical protein